MKEDISGLLESLIPITEMVVGELETAVESKDEEKAESAFSRLLEVKVTIQQLNRVAWLSYPVSDFAPFGAIQGCLLQASKHILESSENPNKVVWASRVIEVARKLTYNVGD